MKNYYDNEQYNLAFDRWLNLMAELILKHGPAVLEKLKWKNCDWRHVGDYIVHLDGCSPHGMNKDNCVVIECFAPAA